MSSTIKELFIWEFTRIGKIPSVYKHVKYSNHIFANKNCLTNNTANLISIILFPSFLESVLVDHNNYELKKIGHRNFSGAGVAIRPANSLDSFLNQLLKTQIRKNLRRSITRLEDCFNISYSYYYGFITKEKLEFLLTTLKSMLSKRFDQKNITNNFLSKWETNVENLLELINQKKASLFVVYDSEKPISISVNRHFENTILFSDCNGYDLDYSKFGLGHLDNYLLVKWCLENNYAFLDLGNGIVEYKKRWCNVYYDFEYQIYYKKNSYLAKFKATLEVNKIKIKNTIKKIKIENLHKVIKAFTKPNSHNRVDEIYNYKISVDILDNYSIDKLKEININSLEAESIRQTIYDYLYSNVINVNNITIYKVANEVNTYLMETSKETLKIYLTDES